MVNPMYFYWLLEVSKTGKKATIHQVTTMLATSRNVLFPLANHRY